jgi:GTP cyclohydrolase III
MLDKHSLGLYNRTCSKRMPHFKRKNSMSNLENLKTNFEAFLEENVKFEAGNGAAGTRARKALQEITKAAKEIRKEITDTKNARKDTALGQ